MTTKPALKLEQFRYPMLRRDAPVLRRSSAELQVGLDQHPAVILADVDIGVEQLLTLLDGCHHIQEIRLLCDRLNVPSEAVDWTLATLSEAGLLIEGGRRDLKAGPGPGRTGATRIRLIGAGIIGQKVAENAARSGIAALHIVDNSPTDSSQYPAAGSLRTQAAALAALLTPSDADVTVADHWSKPEYVAPDLTVIVTDTLECDRQVSDGLLRADEAHLCIRSQGGGGVVVGPLVIPGETPCLRCLDLARRDADPSWPGLLTQLMRLRRPPEPVFASWAGAVAVTQALAFLNGGRPETCGATMEIAATDFLTRWRSWSMHPGCGCGWSLTAH